MSGDEKSERPSNPSPSRSLYEVLQLRSESEAGSILDEYPALATMKSREVRGRSQALVDGLGGSLAAYGALHGIVDAMEDGRG